MKVVWKYYVPIEDEFTLLLPAGARILAVQAQHNEPQMWALVDPNAAPQPRRFRLAGTGHPIEGEWSYLGSFQVHGGNLVFHLFEEA